LHYTWTSNATIRTGVVSRSVRTSKGEPGVIGIEFQQTIPTLSMSGKVPKIELAWTIEKMDKNIVTGVQSKVGQSPRRFVARLSVSPQTDLTAVKAK